MLHEVERPALVAARHEAQEAERPPVLVVGRDGEQQVGVLAGDAAAELHREAALGRAGAPALAHLLELGAQPRRRVGLAEEAEVALRRRRGAPPPRTLFAGVKRSQSMTASSPR